VSYVHDLASDGEGFTIGLTVESLRPWILPPALEPPEILVPGAAARRRVGPELLRFQLIFADGHRVSNMTAIERWRPERPQGPAPLPLETRKETVKPHDRRTNEFCRVQARWWVWPLPAPGTIEVRVVWPAEVMSGLVAFDARPLASVGAGALPAQADDPR
jgi:hypothetical protein